MSKLIDLTGQKFGRLTVVGRAENTKQGQAQWKCECECRTTTVVAGKELRSGRTKSCGCLQREKASENLKKHGHSDEKLYDIWLSMKGRCYNQKNKRFLDYGGRGITVCNEWLSDFQAFYDWSYANGFKKGLSLDRKDNNKGYSPDNCRWVTAKEQNNNTRKNVYIEYHGKVQTLSQWADQLGMNYHTLYNRINSYNWSIEKAFNTP